MPKNPIMYSKTSIYKIVCKDLTITELYVGHTTDFKSRKRTHKCVCNNENKNSKTYNIKIYSFIRENGGWENWTMIEVEKYSCNDLNEASARERYWIETLKANLNMVIPSRTRKEYHEQNKDKAKNYYEDNKEKINEKKRAKRAEAKLK